LTEAGDPIAARFEQWIKENGIIYNLELSEFAYTGRGLGAARDIERNEVR